MHLEVLNDSGKKILPLLHRCGNFYLAGGTALALQIGHRISADFDLFAEKEISKTHLSSVKKVFRDSTITVSVNNSEELTLFINDVKVTFLTYPFPVVLDFVVLEKMPMLGVKELAATKAYTIGRRGSYKDYVDLYFVLSEKMILLEEILDLAKKKYAHEFNGRLFLEQLAYLDDIGDTEIVPLRGAPLDKTILEHFFSEEIRKVTL